MLTRRPRRRAQEGQVLIMALAFIAFFGLVTASLLQLADTVQIQQSHGRSAANANAATEGGAFFAAEAAAKQGSCTAQLTTGPITTGPITMAGTSDSASVTTNACNPGTTADLLADQCAVCVLGPAGPSLSVSGPLTVQGPIAVGGDATSGTTQLGAPDTRSTVGGSGFIGCLGACSGGGFYPPAVKLTTGFPSLTVPTPTIGSTQNCSPPVYDTQGGATISSGCYTSVTLNCSGTSSACPYYLGSGAPIVIEGLLTIGTGNGPPTTVGPAPDSTSTAQIQFIQDGSLLINSDGNLTLQGSSNRDVALYVDPSDNLGPPDVLRLFGGSLSVSGTVDAPDASVNVYGGSDNGSIGSLNVGPNRTHSDSGRLIVGSLDVQQRGEIAVTAAPPTPGYCWVYSDTVTVTTGGKTESGHVLVESDCSGEAGVGIISINYGS